MAEEKQGLVFISCGQYRPEEIRLGESLATTVNELTPFEGYFAQNVTSLEGLSRNIFGALDRCCGFVGVMHHRGEVPNPDGSKRIRGSVWLEQEIAIAAFLKQAHGRDIQVVVYAQRGIGREGVRDQLHLNPIEFDGPDDVIADFRERIGDGRFNPVRLPAPKDVQLRFEHRLTNDVRGQHSYQLSVAVTNSGLEPVTEYWLELQFPKAALMPNTKYGGERRDRETPTHRFFRLLSDKGRTIYPGDILRLFSLDYQMTAELCHDGSIFDQPVIASFGSPGMPSKTIQIPFRDVQDF